ncbi:MAG TPA: TIGR03620 family F420-dependent LLM class oxidoreductase [Acidimicrobiales bacterium]|nr:TIGR03620 family F420-dependent LLM class oxidoreductase [Acidimicrobiales bacterium]
MPRIDLGRFGAVISPATEGFVDQAVELDRLGFSTIWLTGGQMSHLGQVSEVVQATQSARIATGIISVDRFSAADVAELYAELEGVAPGRFVVGLGGAHGASPLSTLNGYLDELEPVPVARRVMAALGPRMLQLARDRAAGAFPVLITPEYAGQARSALGDDTTLAVSQQAVLETDPEQARRIARGPLGFLGKLPAYQASFRRMGFSPDDIENLSDHLVDGLVAWGDAVSLVARAEELHAARADHVAFSMIGDGGSVPLDQWRALAAALR